jgi:HK97 gp10 family phage protein
MADSMGYELSGLSEFVSKLEKLKGLDLSKIGSVGCYTIEELAAPLVPVDTGFLRNSASVESIDGGASLTYGASYSWYVENGTSKMAAQPYVRPTIDNNSELILSKMGDEVSREESALL